MGRSICGKIRKRAKGKENDVLCVTAKEFKRYCTFMV